MNANDWVRPPSVAADLAAVERRVAGLYGGGVASPPPALAAHPGDATGAGSAFARDVESLVRQAARAERVDPSLASAVARTESNFDPQARSPAGAAGVMQLMPATAQALGVENPYDPAQNARGGARYLRELLDRFGGDVRRAVAAYNAGPGAVERFGGVPPFAETHRYVDRVMDAYRAARR
jgi:soluble lytic murein transglycosylase-like protein